MFPYKTRAMEGNPHRGDVIVLDKPEQIQHVHKFALCQAIETHLRFNGRMRLTRTATPARLRELATRITGKPYARSRKGLELALNDLRCTHTNVNLIGNDEQGLKQAKCVDCDAPLQRKVENGEYVYGN